jgi:hypothetical protein
LAWNWIVLKIFSREIRLSDSCCVKCICHAMNSLSYVNISSNWVILNCGIFRFKGKVCTDIVLCSLSLSLDSMQWRIFWNTLKLTWEICGLLINRLIVFSLRSCHLLINVKHTAEMEISERFVGVFQVQLKKLFPSLVVDMISL